mmetsp:Transcript_40821/g.74736  ORF Transcript_40821/g.74736 Transcript_40821/m.74736 type:complete len:687 (-) Transcript_40821:201-2261(-)
MNPGQQPPALTPLPSKKNPRYPSKTCKYAGVTFRASRDKYQARIYKGNKEYNLGLFDVSADAALAYDVAHRLVKKISAAHGKEKETLEAYESDKNAPDWLDYGEDANANSGLDPDKLNFLRPLDFKVEREKELNESQIAGTQKHENCPKLDELRVVVHKEAIRVVKIIVGAIDGGTNNYRRKSKKAAAMQDGVLQDGTLKNPSKKKRRKSKESATSDKAKENAAKKPPSEPNIVSSAWVPKDGADAYYQATGLGRPVPNPSRTKKKEHPFGPPPVVPVGQTARNNPQMMRHMGKSTLQAMLEDDPKAAAFLNNSSNGVEHLMNKALNDRQQHGGDNGDNTMDKGGAPENQTLGSNDNNSFLSEDTMQAGNVSNKTPADFNFMGMPQYYGMGMGGSNNDASGISNCNQDEFNSTQSPENYREFFKNMRNYFPGMGGAGPMGQNNMPEDFQRMMLARAMGQNAGVHNTAAMGMMGMENPPSLNQGNMFNNGFGDQKKDNNKQLENLKSMMQSGMDRSMMQGGMDRSMMQGGIDGPPHNAHPGQISPTTLNMIRAGGFSSSQGNQSPYGAATREQLAGMYGGDRFSQQLRALQSSQLQSSQLGLNQSSFGQFSGRGEGGSSRSDQQAFLQSFAHGQQPSFPQGSNVPGGGGGGYNPAFDDMAQLFGMPGSSHPSSRNQGNNNDGTDKFV